MSGSCFCADSMESAEALWAPPLRVQGFRPKPGQQTDFWYLLCWKWSRYYRSFPETCYIVWGVFRREVTVSFRAHQRSAGMTLAYRDIPSHFRSSPVQYVYKKLRWGPVIFIIASRAYFLCKRRVNLSVCTSLGRRRGATESYLPRRPITAHAASHTVDLF